MKWGYVQLVLDAVVVWGIVVGELGVKVEGGRKRGEGWMPWLVFG